MGDLSELEECPECHESVGWYIEEKPSIFVDSDGEVRLGTSNGTRWGEKFKATCNNPDCDAVVNIYLSGKVETVGEIQSTGAKELAPVLEEYFPVIRNKCKDCGSTFLTEPDFRISGTGGIQVNTPRNCGCKRRRSLFYERETVIGGNELLDKDLEQVKKEEE